MYGFICLFINTWKTYNWLITITFTLLFRTLAFPFVLFLAKNLQFDNYGFAELLGHGAGASPKGCGGTASAAGRGVPEPGSV